ncbi:MAG: hypothetical protein ACRD28_06220 [Acidobacteriaceae bacterium]
MMRSAILSFVISMFLVSGALAQSPTNGHVEAGAYLNSYFRFSYSLPKILHPVDTASLKLRPPSQANKEFLLFAAKESDKPFGVLILAERIPSFYRQRSDGLRESEDFLEQVKKWWDPTGHPQILSQTHLTNVDGLTFDELDYIHFREYRSAIVTPIGEFMIVFSCTAKSASDLAIMTKSVLTTRRLNEPGEQSK